MFKLLDVQRILCNFIYVYIICKFFKGGLVDFSDHHRSGAGPFGGVPDSYKHLREDPVVEQ